ncbi:NADP-dependent oxidoreductase [Rhodomicrobium lacus]|uniref:NADP-dependent oxidoreductase n=1 Tax=Rhodomicrobium lacus TaxID=2498452 RepID=UPI0026E48289|nr:NADP-dependent oxidoreductase [Rhodomicrobium lacus]WKW52284.1 NADP-dependent oxidoreductase [Rhodomicrobium lacus]
MRAIVLEQFGPIDNLKEAEVPIPVPSAGEVLIKTSAVSVNPIDYKTRQGKGANNWTSFVLPEILGWDLSGTVVALGADVTEWKVGDEVFGSIGFPGLGRVDAEYAVAQAVHLARKPSAIRHEEAAAASMAGLTAWQALTRLARPERGQRVLVHAASGGVGHMAVQIAKAFGAHVTGTSSAANRDFVLSLGADAHIDYRSLGIEDYPHDFDFVFDPLGGDATFRSLDLVKKGGTVVSILPQHDPRIFAEAAAKGVAFDFVLMQSRTDDMGEVAKLLGDEAIRPRIAKTFPLSELGQAHALLETGRTAGKIVLTV